MIEETHDNAKLNVAHSRRNLSTGLIKPYVPLHFQDTTFVKKHCRSKMFSLFNIVLWILENRLYHNSGVYL